MGRQDFGKLNVLGIESSLCGGDFQLIVPQFADGALDLASSGFLKLRHAHLPGGLTEDVGVHAQDLVGIDRPAIDHQNDPAESQVLIAGKRWKRAWHGAGNAIGLPEHEIGHGGWPRGAIHLSDSGEGIPRRKGILSIGQNSRNGRRRGRRYGHGRISWLSVEISWRNRLSLIRVATSQDHRKPGSQKESNDWSSEHLHLQKNTG